MKSYKMLIAAAILTNSQIAICQNQMAVPINSMASYSTRNLEKGSTSQMSVLRENSLNSTNSNFNESNIKEIGNNILAFEANNELGSKIVFKNKGLDASWSMSGTPNKVNGMPTLGFNYSKTGDVLTLAANGNVGIGTVNPNYLLDVNGTMRAKEIIVETGWADYVFEKTYKLPKLSEVEKYFLANKHLPGITSAKKIKEDGAPMAELLTQMMSKIEELTLYAVQQQKEIDVLKNQIRRR